MRPGKRGGRAHHIGTLMAAVTKAEARVRTLERRAAASPAPRPLQTRAIELDLAAERILLGGARRDFEQADKNARGRGHTTAPAHEGARIKPPPETRETPTPDASPVRAQTRRASLGSGQFDNTTADLSARKVNR